MAWRLPRWCFLALCKRLSEKLQQPPLNLPTCGLSWRADVVEPRRRSSGQMQSLLRLFTLLLVVSLLPGVCSAGDTRSFGSGSSPVTGGPASGASSSVSPFEITIPAGEVAIPGPLRSFLRMAGISQKASPEEVLPLLAGQMRLRGYAHGRPTEYLVLLRRYLHQARDISKLAAGSGTLHVTNCEDAKPLLAALGYRLHQPCGAQTAVQTDDPELAFLTIDSGFPLA